MDRRSQELSELKEYVDNVEKETTMLLQNLQWDVKHLIESPMIVSCKYVAAHKIPNNSVEAHEKQCYLKQQGYTKEDVLLPDPIHPNADTIVKFSKQDIVNILNKAATSDPSFKKGIGSGETEPLSVERLQQAYTADERRAIHDAVVAAAPVCHDLADFTSSGSGSTPTGRQTKSHAEVLAELRDMKRRRARYRVPATTSHYSDVLRGVIKTQMELYAEAKGVFIKTEYGPKSFVSLQDKFAKSEYNISNIAIKKERNSLSTDRHHESSSRHRDRSRSRDLRQRNDTYKRRNLYDVDGNSSDKRRSKKFSQDKYLEEKRQYDDSYSKWDKYYKSGATHTNHDGDDVNTSKESTSTKDYRTNDGHTHHRPSKYDKRNFNNSSTNRSSTSDTKSTDDHKHKRYREETSNGSKYDYGRKDDEYRRSNKHSDPRREETHRRHRDYRGKEERDGYYTKRNDESKKRKESL